MNGISQRFRFAIKWHKQNISFFTLVYNHIVVFCLFKGDQKIRWTGREAHHSPLFKMLMMSVPSPYSSYVLLCHPQEQFYLYLVKVK